MSTTDSIVWLHLSDLHLCPPKTGWDCHRVLDPLLQDLKRMEQERGLCPDMIFFTGDAAYGAIPDSPLSEQYAEVARFLDGVRGAFTKEVPKQNVFLVPGNHDVDRNKVTPMETQWLDGQSDQRTINELMRKAGTPWQRYRERLDRYHDFLRGHGYDHLLTDPQHLLYAHTREVGGLKMGIAGMNSAWSCGRNDEKGKVWLGGNWQSGEIVRRLREDSVDIRLALMHHPYGWFTEHEDASLHLQFEREFHLLLHGHEHLGWVDAKADGHVRIAAGACYESSWMDNGYNFVRLDLNTGKGEVWLRRYDREGGGWVPKAIAGKTGDEGCWPLKNLPWLRKASDNGPIVEPNTADVPAGQTAPLAEACVVSDAIRLEVRKEIRKLLRNPVLAEVGKALVKEVSPAQTAEEWLVPLDIHPFPVVEKIRALRSAIRDVFRSEGEEFGSNRLADAAKSAKAMLEWLLLLAVPDAWTQAGGSSASVVSGRPPIDIPEKLALWAELGDGRLRQTKPWLEASGPNKVEVVAPNQMGYKDLERGLTHEDALQEVLRMIWDKVMKAKPSPEYDLSKQLASTLLLRLEDGERYHIAIPQKDYDAIAGNPVWARDLGPILEHLGVFVYYAKGAGQRVLIVPEDELLVYIREYLRLLGEYA